MKNIGIVISVTTYSHRRRSRSLLERNARELDNIIILREFIKHLRHLRIALYDVGQTIERRVVENIANHVRVNDSTVGVVHEGPCVDRYQRLDCRAKVVRRQIRAVGQLDVDQRVYRNCRVRCDLDKRVEG